MDYSQKAFLDITLALGRSWDRQPKLQGVSTCCAAEGSAAVYGGTGKVTEWEDWKRSAKAEKPIEGFFALQMRTSQEDSFLPRPPE